MTALALAAAELKRVTRDRTFLFFLVVLPILVILLVGLTTASRHQHSHCRGGRANPLHWQRSSSMAWRPAPR
jgi:hypothetical protein